MEYIIPGTAAEIYDTIGDRSAYFLAGGTDIMVMKKQGELDDRLLVDISQLEELKGIYLENRYINVGALTTMGELSKDRTVKNSACALHDAASAMGSPLIRNLATIGGNIANSNPAGDIIPPLYALDGVLVVQKGSRSKEIPVNEFCLGPCANVLSAGEIITRIKIPVLEGERSSFLKIGARRALTVAKVSVAVRWFLKEGKIIDICIAMGAVGPKCIRAKRTEQLLKGRDMSPELTERAAQTIEHEACPIDDFRSTSEYRRSMTGVLLKRLMAQM